MDKWILGLLTKILTVISPELRLVVSEWLGDLETRAKATPNPWDDIFVTFLKLLLNAGTAPTPEPPAAEGE